MAKKKIHIAVRVLAWIVTLPVLVLGVGFIFHTDVEPSVLGKYTTGYFVFLLCWWLLLTPGVYYFARFVFGTQRIELTSGRVLHVRPTLKILLTLLLGWGLAWVLQYRVSKALGHGVTTAQQSDVYHPYLQNFPKPRRRFSINQWGFRGASIEREKPANTYRIFALGGSTTFAGALKLEDTYEELLAAQLRAAHPDKTIEIQNAGGDWHCSQHSLIKYLITIQEFEPDLLLVFHGINDLGRSLSPDMFSSGEFRSDYGHFLGPVSNLVRKDTTWPFVRMRFGYWFSDFLCDQVIMGRTAGRGAGELNVAFFPKTEPIEIDEWPSLSTYERTMRDLVMTARAKGIRIVIASQPHQYRDDFSDSEKQRVWVPTSHQFDGKRASIASMKRGMDRINALTAKIAKDTSAGYVDLDAIVPKTFEYLYDEVHHTEKATAKIAAAFFEYIEREKLLEK